MTGSSTGILGVGTRAVKCAEKSRRVPDSKKLSHPKGQQGRRAL